MLGLTSNVIGMMERIERSIRVCVIGNSYTGAIKKVYSSDKSYSDLCRLSFFASVAEGFRKIDIKAGQLTNATFADGESVDIDDYDAFVIYGDMPSETMAFFVSSEANEAAYSDRFRRSRFEGWLNASKAYRLCRDLTALTDKNIFVVSENAPLNRRVGTPEQRRIGLDLIQEFLDPAMFVAMPNALFQPDGHPRSVYYNGSLDVSGQAADADKFPMHDNFHFNEVGGKLMLMEILDVVAKNVRS